MSFLRCTEANVIAIDIAHRSTRSSIAIGCSPWVVVELPFTRPNVVVATVGGSTSQRLGVICIRVGALGIVGLQIIGLRVVGFGVFLGLGHSNSPGSEKSESEECLEEHGVFASSESLLGGCGVYGVPLDSGSPTRHIYISGR